MSYQRESRPLAGKRGRRGVDEEEYEGRPRRAVSRRLGSGWDEDGVEWDVNEWSGVLYTDRIRNVSRVR